MFRYELARAVGVEAVDLRAYGVTRRRRHGDGVPAFQAPHAIDATLSP